MVVHARRANKDASRRWLLLATRNRAYGLRCEPHTRLLRPLREPTLWTSDAQHRYLIVVATARAQLPFSFGVPAQVLDDNYEQHWDESSQQHSRAWHAPFVEALKDLRDLTIARHQELDRNQIDNCGVCRREKEKTEYNTDD